MATFVSDSWAKGIERDGKGELVALKVFGWCLNSGLHPWRLTWNIIMEVWKIIFLSKWVICRFHVNLPGCNKAFFKGKPNGSKYQTPQSWIGFLSDFSWFCTHEIITIFHHHLGGYVFLFPSILNQSEWNTLQQTNMEPKRGGGLFRWCSFFMFRFKGVRVQRVFGWNSKYPCQRKFGWSAISITLRFFPDLLLLPSTNYYTSTCGEYVTSSNFSELSYV